MKSVKRKSKKIIAAGWLMMLFLNPLCLADTVKQQSIVVTTSMLACAANELIPYDGTFHIISILPPGACPGHFDLKPDILPHLQQASLIIRHDYQDELESKLKGIGAGAVNVISIKTPGSLLIPDNYIKLIDQIKDVLIACYPCKKDWFLKKQKDCQTKVNQLKEKNSDKDFSWKGQPVIAAVYQKQFVTYLGFNVVGLLKRTEETTPLDIKKLMQTKAAMIIGNYQSGADAAEALGKRMHLPVAIISNFPDTKGYGREYEELIENNIEKINQAWKKK